MTVEQKTSKHNMMPKKEFDEGIGKVDAGLRGLITLANNDYTKGKISKEKRDDIIKGCQEGLDSLE